MGGYNVYQREEPVNNVTTAKKIDRKQSEEEAKKLVYKLNEWKYEK